MEPTGLDAVFTRAVEDWGARSGSALALAAALGLVVLGWRRLADRRPTAARWAGLAMLGLSLGIGLRQVWTRLSLVDDAFISFRYARNLREGEGLVFNAGEKVEGITNLLWTVILAGLAAIGPYEEPHWALILCALAYVARVGLLADIGRRLFGGDAPYLPIAASLLAVQFHVIGFASTGLETAFVGMLVELGVWMWVRLDGPRGAAGLGLGLILATLTRPDIALVYACFSFAVAADRGMAWRQGTPLVDALKPCAAYAAPFALWLAVTAWRVHYYGDLYPNTYYAKSADLTYLDQGAVYGLLFYLGTHLWIAWVLWLVWMATPVRHAREGVVRVGALTSLVVHQLWAIKVGGDFMDGRFFVPTIGLLLLGAEGAVWHWLRRPDDTSDAALPRGLAVFALTAALGITVSGKTLVDRIEFLVADEGSFHQVVRLWPLKVDHHSSRQGKTFHHTMTAKGLHPILATSGIGQVGWYSELEIIDKLGLTDATVARGPRSPTRSRVGHERRATHAYLAERGVHFIRGNAGPSHFARLTRLKLRGRGKQMWNIFRYDRALMDELAEVSPGVRFVDFPTWLADYVDHLEDMQRARVRRDLVFLDRYYFDHNDDLEDLRAKIVARTRLPPNSDGG